MGISADSTAVNKPYFGAQQPVANTLRPNLPAVKLGETAVNQSRVSVNKQPNDTVNMAIRRAYGELQQLLSNPRSTAAKKH